MNDVLMGRNNPNGWKLEELLNKLAIEVKTKCGYIEADSSIEARTVLRNNQQIIGLLQQAEALQRMSYDVLDNKAPNEGVNGKYRIGEQRAA